MVTCIDWASGDIVYQNACFKRTLGKPAEGESQNIYDHVDDQSYIPLTRLLKNAKEKPNQQAEFCFLDNQGECFEVAMSSHLNPYDPNQLILFLSDIREQKKRDRSLGVYQQIFSSTEELIALIDTNYRYQVVNRAYLEHHEVSEQDVIGCTLFDLYQDDASELVKVIDRTLKQGEVVRELHPYSNRRCKGEVLYIDSMNSPYYDKQGNISGVIVSARDVTQQHNAEREMESSQGYYKMLFKYSPDMLASVNIDTGQVIECNNMFSTVMGYHCTDVVDSSVFSFHAQQCKERLAEAVAALNEQDAISDLELYMVSKSGESISVSLRTTPMVDLERNIAIFVWRDTRKQKQLAHDAVHDTLTGLLNRAGFMERFEKLFRRNEGKILCYIDVDNFKILNDTYGHLRGDRFLIEMAELMRTEMPEAVLGRLGGDEFVAMLNHDNLMQAEALLQTVNSKIQSFVADHDKYRKSQLGVSIGITPYTNEEARRVVLQRADNACYESKRTGKHKVTVYEVQAV